MGVSLNGSRSRLQSSYFNVGEVINDYLTWLGQIFYVLVYRFNYNEGEYEYAAFRSPKRGDALYARRVMKKFNDLIFKLDSELFYRRRDRRNTVISRVLYIVLEYDLNRFDLLHSWGRCGIDFNRYMTYLRRHFGKCSIIRSYEAHESALCHINLVVLFHNRTFQGRLYKKKYRVFDEDWKKLKAGWSHGFSNVQMVDSVQGGAYYLRKYLSKAVSVDEAGSKRIKGLAMCWFMRKRSFSISGEFRSLYSDVINLNSNSTVEDENGIISVLVGKDLLGGNIYFRATKWKLLGFLLSDHVIWQVNFVMLESTQIICVDESRRLFELAKDEVIVDKCQMHL